MPCWSRRAALQAAGRQPGAGSPGQPGRRGRAAGHSGALPLPPWAPRPRGAPRARSPRCLPPAAAHPPHPPRAGSRCTCWPRARASSPPSWTEGTRLVLCLLQHAGAQRVSRAGWPACRAGGRLARPGGAQRRTRSPRSPHPPRLTSQMMWGTSMACPMVAGTAALLQARAIRWGSLDLRRGEGSLARSKGTLARSKRAGATAANVPTRLPAPRRPRRSRQPAHLAPASAAASLSTPAAAAA